MNKIWIFSVFKKVVNKSLYKEKLKREIKEKENIFSVFRILKKHSSLIKNNKKMVIVPDIKIHWEDINRNFLEIIKVYFVFIGKNNQSKNFLDYPRVWNKIVLN